MITKSENTKHVLSLTLFYTAFLFLWMTVLIPANHAGEGRLSARQMESVYYILQVFLVGGFLSYAALTRFHPGGRFRRGFATGALAVFFAGGVVLLFADRSTPFYVAVTMAVMLCLGGIGGAVYHRMSLETASGTATARCMGVGSAVAVLLQFLLQLRWGQSLLLPFFMLAAFLLLSYRLLGPYWGADVGIQAGAEEPGSEKVRSSRILIVCLITVLFYLFCDFYNEYIQHLHILSGFAAHSPYQWPRLMMIPCYLLFAVIGDKKQGRLVPIAALVIALVAMLNPVLTGSSGAFWLNMCLFYCSLAATICYAALTFWRLAPGTRHPALWACMGRVLDSAMVLVTAAVRLDTLPPAAVMGLDIAGVALIILMMALGGDFNLNAAIAAEAPLAVEMPAVPEIPTPLSPEETLEKMRQRYTLTPRETEVLRQLVLTEDKQTAIAERLSIQVKTLQDYVTRLYRKTGAATRAGLTDLYHENRQQQ